MIKRVLIFLALLAAGFAALLLLTDDQQGAQVPKTEPVTTERPPQSSTPTLVAQDRGQEIGVIINGGFQLNAARYRLGCRDSSPIGDGRQRLDDMTAELFDEGRHAADLKAVEATVELGRDERGNPSIKQDKDVLMKQAVFTSVPGPNVPPLRFELQEARLHFLEQAVELQTPGEHDPVLLVIEGDRPSRLEGEGLESTLPNGGSRGPRRLMARVLHVPVFTTEQAVVRSSGPLELQQDLDGGNGLFTAVEQVQLDLQAKGGLSLPGAGEASAGNVTVTGDRLDAWLSHEHQAHAASATSGRTQWTMLRVTGAPAVARGQGSSLQGGQLWVLPGSDGRPFLVTASGGSCELVRTDAADPSRFTAARSIHLFRPGLPAIALHRSLGFPAWSLGQLEPIEAAVFLGAATASLPDGSRVNASDGLWLMQRPAADPAADPTVPPDRIARGSGDVQVSLPAEAGRTGSRSGPKPEPPMQTRNGHLVTVSGNDGFRLTQASSGRNLVFGPPDPAAGTGHRYTIEYGDMVVHGGGACAFEQRADGGAVARLRSTRPDIDGELGARGSVHGATAVDLDLPPSASDAAPSISSLVASGPHLEGTLLHGGTTWTVGAARIERDGSGRWQLTGDAEHPATLRHAGAAGERASADDVPGLVSAPLILLFELGPHCAVVEAHAQGSRRAEVETEPDSKGYSLHLWADELRALPFAVTRQVLDAHLGGTSAQMGWLPGFELARPWLTARGNVIADVTEPENGRAHAEGALLLMAGGSRSALLVGDADAQQPAFVTRFAPASGRTNCWAPRIQISSTEGLNGEIRLLPTWPGLAQSVPPRIELRDQHSRGTGGIANLAGTCRGEIEVLEDRVLFHGPVRAHALTPAGVEDPTGMHIAAEQLDIRKRETEVIEIRASHGVRLDWARITARAEDLTLDLLSNLCTVSDPNGAEVAFPNGIKVKALLVEADYVTQVYRTWHSRTAMRTAHGDRKLP